CRARRRTPARLAKSARALVIRCEPERSATSRRARSVRPASRPTSTTCIPRLASPSAVWSPIPALAPVTMATRSAGLGAIAGDQPLRLDDLGGGRPDQKADQRHPGLPVLRRGGEPGGIGQIRRLQFSGNEPDDLDARGADQLADRLHAQLGLAMRHRLADGGWRAGAAGHQLGPGLELIRDAETPQDRGDMYAAGAAARRVG